MTSDYKPKKVEINTLSDAKKHLRRIDCDEAGIPIMAPKAVFHVIELQDVVMQDAVILKQEMLSTGGEIAIPKNAYELFQEKSSILVMGTLRQQKQFAEKLLRHYPRIQDIGGQLSTYLKTLETS